MIFTKGYRKITIAQGPSFDQDSPFKVGDYAIIIKSDDETWPENKIVKIIDMTRGDYALIRQFRRGDIDTTLFPKRGLKKIWVVNPTSNLELEETSREAVEPTQLIRPLSQYDPELFEYLGERINAILKSSWDKEDYKKHAGEFIKSVGKGKFVPVLDPNIVIANFLGGEDGTQGFVAKWGEQVKNIFVNKNTVFSYDEVIAHEFSHVLSFESYHIAKRLNNEFLKFGIEDYEMDEEEWLEMQKEKHQQKSKIKNRGDMERANAEQYFFQPTETFAHTEQVRRMLHKLKRDEIATINRQFELDQISEEQKNSRIEFVKSKPVDEYKDLIVNKLMLDSPKKFDIFSSNDRRKLYERIFENSKRA